VKYTVSLDIDLPRERVVALFDDHQNYKRWMTGLRSIERLPDGKHKLTFLFGRREMVLVETIARRELPELVEAVYQGPDNRNGTVHRFAVIDAGRTRWEQTTEFQFDGLFMKLQSAVLPGMFRKQTLTYMKCFKDFAESQSDEGFERTQFEAR